MKYCSKNLRLTDINRGDNYECCIQKVSSLLAELTGVDLVWLEMEKCMCNNCEGNTKEYCDGRYYGEDLPLLGVKHGDHYDDIFMKIEEFLMTFNQ